MDVNFSAAVSGLSAASAWLDATAGNVANALTPGYTPARTVLASTAPAPGVAVSQQAGAATATVAETLATQLPDSMFAAMMAKADVAVMTKAIEAYEAAMKDFAAAS
jgi:flagellar basal body rod protein FlgB